MSSEERLQALEQLVTVMHSEVISALTAAAQAEQRATDAETRVLGVGGEGTLDCWGNQRSSTERQTTRRQFKFTFLGYAGAVNAIMNSALLARDQRVSTQLYYMLVLLLEDSAQRLLEHAGDGEGLLSWRSLLAEYEPATVGGETTLLLEVLAQTCKGDVRGSLDEFGVKIRKYESTTLCSHRNCSSTVDQARGHPFLIHGNAKGQARHAVHFSVTVGSRTSSSDQHAKAAIRVAQAALYLHTQDVTRDAKTHEMEVRKANERIATATAQRELRVASVVAERRLRNTWRMRRRRITTTPWHISQSSSKNTTRRRSVRKNMTSTT